MAHQTAYNVSSFAANIDTEIQRLDAQVDLFWPEEGNWLEKAGLKDGMRVLDCGCGPGRVLELIHRRWPLARLEGVELDPILVEYSNKRLSVLGFDSPVKQGSAEAPGLEAEAFDFIVMRLVLEHIPNPLYALNSLTNLLKPDGILFVISNDFEYHLRTDPPVPELDLLYDAYMTARRADGGDPCIGRRVPSLMRQAGLEVTSSAIELAHNAVIGDAPFLKAEGAGIPAQLVQKGYLAEATLERLTHNWLHMLQTPGHSMARQLWLTAARRPAEWKDNPVSTLENQTQDQHLPLATVAAATTGEELTEIQLLELVCTQLKIDSALASDSLEQLGIDSIGAIMLQQKIKARTGLELPITQLLKDQPIARIFQLIKEASLPKASHPQTSPSMDNGNDWDEGEL